MNSLAPYPPYSTYTNHTNLIQPIEILLDKRQRHPHRQYRFQFRNQYHDIEIVRLLLKNGIVKDILYNESLSKYFTIQEYITRIKKFNATSRKLQFYNIIIPLLLSIIFLLILFVLVKNKIIKIIYGIAILLSTIIIMAFLDYWFFIRNGRLKTKYLNKLLRKYNKEDVSKNVYWRMIKTDHNRTAQFYLIIELSGLKPSPICEKKNTPVIIDIHHSNGENVDKSVDKVVNVYNVTNTNNVDNLNVDMVDNDINVYNVTNANNVDNLNNIITVNTMNTVNNCDNNGSNIKDANNNDNNDDDDDNDDDNDNDDNDNSYRHQSNLTIDNVRVSVDVTNANNVDNLNNVITVNTMNTVNNCDNNNGSNIKDANNNDNNDDDDDNDDDNDNDDNDNSYRHQSNLTIDNVRVSVDNAQIHTAIRTRPYELKPPTYYKIIDFKRNKINKVNEVNNEDDDCEFYGFYE